MEGKRIFSSLTTFISDICFKKQVSLIEFRAAMTLMLNTRLNQCSQTLQGHKLLAKLRAGDVVDQELKYHCICLTVLNNREKANLKMKTSIE